MYTSYICICDFNLKNRSICANIFVLSFSFFLFKERQARECRCIISRRPCGRATSHSRSPRRFPARMYIRINASLRRCAWTRRSVRGEQNTEKETAGEREREWAETRLGTSVVGQGAAATGAGTWRVNASTSKWLAGTIIALNALVATESCGVVRPYTRIAEIKHTGRCTARIRSGRRERRILHSFAFNWTRTLI